MPVAIGLFVGAAVCSVLFGVLRMLQPDSRLFRPTMYVRGAIIAVMVVAYTTAWILIPQSTQFAIMSGILVVDAFASAVLYVMLSPRKNALLVHLSLIIDTVASTGLILCTGYAGSLFPLFYLLILLAAGLLFGQSTGLWYFLCVSLANVTVLMVDRVEPMFRSRPQPFGGAYLLMGAALPLVAFPLLLVFRLTQRGRYLEALYENISDGLYILDDVGRIVEANGRAAAMIGRRRSELLGLPLESLVALGEGGAAIIQDQLRRCLDGDPVSFELLLDRRDESALPVEINAQLVSGHSPGRIQAFARDISGRRLMEAEIRRQNEELRRVNQELQVGRDVALNASRLKSQFLANMSHELRTPLNSIIGYTQFVLEDPERPLAADQREDLTRVLKSARHLLDLINGVLDLARIESGRESVSISRFAAGDLIDSIVDAVTPMAKAKGLDIRCRVESGIAELRTDEKKLRQILLNLAANAVKFTERGFVRLDCAAADPGHIEIRVTDSGVGIPREHREEIFSEFHQVDPSVHKQHGGTGLGLAIVRRLVELLKGTIQVESVVGKGSTFTVRVPVILALSEAADRLPGGAASEGPPSQVVVLPDASESVAAEP